MSSFRILSLDGGGIMGAFSASVLATYERLLEEEREGKNLPPMRLVDHFDLITGTSTGGIIAVGLAMGEKADKILGFYRDAGPRIFPKSSGIDSWRRSWRSIFRPKFSTEELRAAVAVVAGDKTLSRAETKLVVPSYNAEAGRIHIFKTPHHRDVRQDRDVLALDVALATSAAPTYFPAHRIPGRGKFVDGGIWANCPAVVGIVEAVSFLDQMPKDIHVLSISTTNYPFSLGKSVQLGGLVNWGPRIIETFMFAQIQGSLGLAQCLLRDRDAADGAIRDRLHRIDSMAAQGDFSMADTSGVERLIDLGRTEAEKAEHRSVVMRDFLNGVPASRFQPV
ncbi:MAG: CBASS cGAMP-activated phospholipase [Isosphaeraceae bacterium]|nr:CBASS cGAMP-activated phospholipase [Isosphaeraceae bacterium]